LNCVKSVEFPKNLCYTMDRFIRIIHNMKGIDRHEGILEGF